jgi:hypothetical protein
MFEHIRELLDKELELCWMFNSEVRFLKEVINGFQFQIGATIVRINRSPIDFTYKIENLELDNNRLEVLDEVFIENDKELVNYMPKLLKNKGIVC